MTDWKREADAYLLDLGDKREMVLEVFNVLLRRIESETRLETIEKCVQIIQEELDILSARRAAWINHNMALATNDLVYLTHCDRLTREMGEMGNILKKVQALKGKP